MPELTQEQLATEQTGPQTVLGLGLLFGNGGCVGNPCGFPAYDKGYGRTYWTYDWMLRHPIVQLVREIRTAPIKASYWQYKPADKSVAKARVDFIEKMFDPIRAQSISEILDGPDYGWAPFEPIWDNAGGETRLLELKALEQQVNEQDALAVDSAGNNATGLPAPYKAWVYTYRKKKGNIFGLSWLENIRETAWKDWLDCAQQIQKIGAKIAGTQAIIKSPESKKAASIQLIKDLSNGAPGGWVPSLAANIDPGTQVDLWKLVMELTKASFVTIDVLDFGSTAPAITNILERMKHDEELMFAGGLRPSRTGLEGKHGTKAESGVMTDTGMLSAESEDDDIAMQAQSLVDAALVLNFGPEAKGSVLIDAPPLVDSKAQRYTDLVKAITAGNTALQTAIAAMADMPEVLDGMDCPLRQDAAATFQKALDAIQQQAAQKAQQPPPVNADVPVNGNGNVNPRTAKAANRINRMLGR
jgi:hypothetical protein